MTQNSYQVSRGQGFNENNLKTIFKMPSQQIFRYQIGLSQTPPKHKNSQDFSSQASTQSDEYFMNSNQIYQFNVKLKTSLCRNYVRDGFCPYGDKCQFAHGIQELKTQGSKKNNYKTKLCSSFSKKGFCPYGSRCNFKHPQTFKTNNELKNKENNFGSIIRQERRERKARQQKQSRLLKILLSKNQSLSQILEMNQYNLKQNEKAQPKQFYKLQEFKSDTSFEIYNKNQSFNDF